MQETLSRAARFAGIWLAAGLVCRAAADSLLPSDDYVAQVWDTDSGLPHSTVTSIVQTPDGYLWVGTLHGGLARFDGSRFVNFHPGNTPELKSIEIHKLLVDARGTLWIGNVEGGIVAYRDGCFQFEYSNSDTPGSWLNDILDKGPSRLEFSSQMGMVFRRIEDSAAHHWEVVARPDANETPMMHKDRDGVIWYVTREGQLAQLRGASALTLTNPPGLRTPLVNVLSMDASGGIWVGTDKEIACWNGGGFVTMTPTNGEPEVRVRQMIPCRDGGFWVLTPNHARKCLGRVWTVEATVVTNGIPQEGLASECLGASIAWFVDSQGGLWFWHAQKGIGHIHPNGRLAWVGEAEGRLSGSVQCWLEDRESNIWVGLTDGGLARLRPRVFHAVWPADGVDSKSARSVCEDEIGQMWFGTAGKQVWRLRGGLLSVFTPPEQGFFEETKVLPAGDGRLWVGSVRNGLMGLRDGEFERPFPAKDIGTVARCLYRGRDGALWIGSEFGLFRWDKGVLKTFTAADGFSPAYVLSIAEDKAGDVWLGTALGELRRFHDGTFATFTPNDSLTDEAALRAAAVADPMGQRNRGALSGGERFWALRFDDDGVLWIGTLGGGLLRFADGRFTRFTAHEGLPNEHVSQILEDDRARLWLGTRAGIVRVSKRELNEAARGGKAAPTFLTYGKSDGLPTLECSGGSQPNCWRARDGRLWFTTAKGAVWVEPSALRLNPLRPPVHVEEVRVDGRSLSENNAPLRLGGARAHPTACRRRTALFRIQV